MKTDEAVLLGGLALVGVYLIGSKAVATSNLVFYPGTITGMSMNGTTPVIGFTMLVQNTSSTPLTLNSFAGNIFSNGTLIGNVSDFTAIAILPNSQSLVPVNASLNPLTIVNDLIRAFQFGNFSQSIQVSAVANIQGVQLPVNLTFNVGAAPAPTSN